MSNNKQVRGLLILYHVQRTLPNGDAYALVSRLMDEIAKEIVGECYGSGSAAVGVTIIWADYYSDRKSLYGDAA